MTLALKNRPHFNAIVIDNCMTGFSDRSYRATEIASVATHVSTYNAHQNQQCRAGSLQNNHQDTHVTVELSFYPLFVPAFMYPGVIQHGTPSSFLIPPRSNIGRCVSSTHRSTSHLLRHISGISWNGTLYGAGWS